MFFSVFYGRRFYGRSPVCSTIRLLVNSRSCHFLRALRGSAGPNPLHSSLEAALRVRNGFAAPPIPRRSNGCVDFKIIFFFFTNRGYCATIICVTLKLYFVSFYRKAPKALVFRPSLAAVLLPPFPREIDFSFLPVFVSECQP